MSNTYPELMSLPNGWDWAIDPETDCVVYIMYKHKMKSSDHPKHGPLPTPWVFKAFQVSRTPFRGEEI